LSILQWAFIDDHCSQEKWDTSWTENRTIERKGGYIGKRKLITCQQPSSDLSWVSGQVGGWEQSVLEQIRYRGPALRSKNNYWAATTQQDESSSD